MARLKYETKGLARLEVAITNKVNEALDSAGVEILEELKKQIDKDIYQYDKRPVTTYETSYQFRDAWDVKINKKNRLDSVVTIRYMPSKMNRKQHQSIVNDYRVDLKLFPDLFSEENLDSHEERTSSLLYFKDNPKTRYLEADYVSKKRRPFWKNFINRMKKGKMREIIKRHASAKGLKLE